MNTTENDCLQYDAELISEEYNCMWVLHMGFFTNLKGNVTPAKLQEKQAPESVPCSQLQNHPALYFPHCNSLSANAPGFLSSWGVPRERGRDGAHLKLVQTCDQTWKRPEFPVFEGVWNP